MKIRGLFVYALGLFLVMAFLKVRFDLWDKDDLLEWHLHHSNRFLLVSNDNARSIPSGKNVTLLPIGNSCPFW